MKNNEMVSPFSFLWIIIVLFCVGQHLWSIYVDPKYIEFEAKVSNIEYVADSSFFGRQNIYVIYFDNGKVINVYESVVNAPREFEIGGQYYIKFVESFGRGFELVDKESK